MGKNKVQGIHSIEYQSDSKLGNFLNAVVEDSNRTWHYNLKLDKNGKILHILKYDNVYFNAPTNDLEKLRSLELLISDTSNINEPTFFGNPVNGYYNDTFLINNVIYKDGVKRKIAPVSKNEKSLFTLIASLTNKNNFTYEPFDSIKILGWFKYDF